VGSKGELFPPREIRDRLGLRPHERVVYRVEGDRLVVEPVPSLDEVLKERAAVEVSLQEFKKFRRELSSGAET